MERDEKKSNEKERESAMAGGTQVSEQDGFENKEISNELLTKVCK